ncbi:MAG TPA: LAGLIDADG family homing endonuclease [Candidatus Nanoarchaeia archaeon]|nr:LAGLIDADG family homing endonuclease [Candidatus Nanoarchaeia archaeon]
MKKDVACAELLGILCGDGCLSKSSIQVKYFIYCSGNKLKDLDYFKRYVPRLFYEVFEKRVVAKERTDENTVYIKFSDKLLFARLHKLGLPIGYKYDELKIPPFVTKSKGLQLAFIRGVFDTDGCVVLSKQHRTYAYYPRIEICSKSFHFLDSILAVLRRNGFFGSLSKQGKGYYRMELPGFKNLKRWLFLIGTSNKRNLLKFEQASKTYLNVS